MCAELVSVYKGATIGARIYAELREKFSRLETRLATTPLYLYMSVGNFKRAGKGQRISRRTRRECARSLRITGRQREREWRRKVSARYEIPARYMRAAALFMRTHKSYCAMDF